MKKYIQSASFNELNGLNYIHQDKKKLAKDIVSKAYSTYKKRIEYE